LIKTVGAAGGVAAVGTGAAPYADQVAPVQDAQAFACGGACTVGAAFVAGAIAGVAYKRMQEPDIDRDDLSDDREDRVYETALSLTQGKEVWQDITLHEYQNSSAEQTPFGDVAWTTVRTTTATYHANGEDREVAKSKARERLGY